MRPASTLVALSLALWLAVAPARADLPLTVEDLITEQGRLRLDLALAYANVERRGVATGEPIFVQTGPASFVSVPTRIGEHTLNSDTAVGTLGLRYGEPPRILRRLLRLRQ